MISQLILNQTHMDEMLHHVAEHMPLESCGLLAGKDGRVEKVIPVRNQAQSPVRFVMDPYEQLRAFEWIEANRLELVGIFHSHPAGPETASAADIDQAAYEVVHVIWSHLNDRWKARGFWIQGGRAREIDLIINNQ